MSGPLGGFFLTHTVDSRGHVCQWMYTVGHKKRATLFRTKTYAFLDGLQHFVYQRKKE